MFVTEEALYLCQNQYSLFTVWDWEFEDKGGDWEFEDKRGKCIILYKNNLLLQMLMRVMNGNLKIIILYAKVWYELLQFG